MYRGTDASATDAAIRVHLNRVIDLLRPYARSVGQFHDLDDVYIAIALASVSLERAALSVAIARHRAAAAARTPCKRR
jgi:hypothetical protein